MDDTDRTDESQDPEAPDEDPDEALVHIGKYSEARRSLPWEQWTFKEKANFCMDRIFLGFLFIFVLMLMGECGFKIWYVTKVNKIGELLTDLVENLFEWLFTQERQEELFEL